MRRGSYSGNVYTYFVLYVIPLLTVILLYHLLPCSSISLCVPKERCNLFVYSVHKQKCKDDESWFYGASYLMDRCDSGNIQQENECIFSKCQTIPLKSLG